MTADPFGLEQSTPRAHSRPEATRAEALPVVAMRDAQAIYIAHAIACATCTAATRLPGAERCPAGAELWRQYLAALVR